MVLPQLNAVVAWRPFQFLIGLLLIVAGSHHVVRAADSFVTWLFGLAKISGDGILAIAVTAGIFVIAAGLGKIGMVLEEMEVY